MLYKNDDYSVQSVKDMYFDSVLGEVASTQVKSMMFHEKASWRGGSECIIEEVQELKNQMKVVSEKESKSLTSKTSGFAKTLFFSTLKKCKFKLFCNNVVRADCLKDF